MEESGYAGFLMPIEVYFKNKVRWTGRDVISRHTLQNRSILTTGIKQRFPAESLGKDLKNYFNLNIGPY